MNLLGMKSHLFLVSILLLSIVAIVYIGCDKRHSVSNGIPGEEITLIGSMLIPGSPDITITSSSLKKTRRFPSNSALVTITANNETVFSSAIPADDSIYLLPIRVLQSASQYNFSVKIVDPVTNQLLFTQDTMAMSSGDTLEVLFSPKPIGSILNCIIISANRSIDSILLAIDENTRISPINEVFPIPFKFDVPFSLSLNAYAGDDEWMFHDTFSLGNADTTVTLALTKKGGAVFNSSMSLQSLPTSCIEVRLLEAIPREPEVFAAKRDSFNITLAIASDKPSVDFRVAAYELRDGGYWAYPLFSNYIHSFANGICNIALRCYAGSTEGKFRFTLQNSDGITFNTIEASVHR